MKKKKKKESAGSRVGRGITLLGLVFLLFIKAASEPEITVSG